MLPDIQNREDISRLVGTFYARAFEDPIIGYIFTDVARIDLDEHLPVFTDFWETVLFRAGTYKRNALQVHFALDDEAFGQRHPGGNAASRGPVGHQPLISTPDSRS